VRKTIGVVLVMQVVSALTGCSSTQVAAPSSGADAAFRTEVATALKSGNTEAARESLPKRCDQSPTTVSFIC
jgi:hypothetical protein